MKNGQNWEKNLFRLRSEKASVKSGLDSSSPTTLGAGSPGKSWKEFGLAEKTAKVYQEPCSGLWPGVPGTFWHLITYQRMVTCPQSRAPILHFLFSCFQPSLNSTPFIFFQFGWSQPQEIGSMITASSSKKDNGQISLWGVGTCSAISMSL